MAASGKGFMRRLWRICKRVFIILFIAQFIYIILLRWMDPPVTLTQLGSWVSGHGLKRDYVDASDMSVNAKLAVIASEDQLFADHNGFDYKSIEKAMKHNSKSRSLRGASTISQQVAKNLWLGQERSLGRKLEETVLTWRLEQVVQKPRILEVYLNLAELGSGIYGVGQAAQHYFRVPADTLTREQAAQLAALLPAPRRGMDSAWAKRYRELLQRLPRVKIPKAPPELVEKAE